MSPMGSCIWTLVSQLIILFGEVVELLGGRALLGSVYNTGGKFWEFITLLHFCLALSVSCL